MFEILEHFFENHDQTQHFINLLISTHSILTGSLCLQALTNQKWPSCDLDICIQSKYLRLFIEQIQKCNYTYSLIHNVRLQDKYGSLDEIIKQIENTTKTNIIIEVIKLQQKSLMFKMDIIITPSNENFVNQIDISICQNYFDGRHLYAKYHDHIMKQTMVVCYLKNENESSVYMLSNTTRSRIFKYEQRGFTLSRETNLKRDVFFKFDIGSLSFCCYNPLNCIKNKDASQRWIDCMFGCHKIIPCLNHDICQKQLIACENKQLCKNCPIKLFTNIINKIDVCCICLDETISKHVQSEWCKHTICTGCFFKLFVQRFKQRFTNVICPLCRCPFYNIYPYQL